MMKFCERRDKELSEVLNMPIKEQDLWMAWTAKEPTDGERIEFGIAKLCYLVAGLTSKKPPDLSKFVYKADWRDPVKGHAQDMVKEFLKGFG